MGNVLFRKAGSRFGTTFTVLVATSAMIFITASPVIAQPSQISSPSSAANSPTGHQSPAAPEGNPQPSTTAQGDPIAMVEDLQVDFDHPISVADAMQLDDLAPIRELRFDVVGAAGGVGVTASDTVESVEGKLNAATLPHGFSPPISGIVYLVPWTTSSPMEEVAPAQRIPPVQEDLDEGTLAQRVRSRAAELPEQEAEGEPQQPELGQAPRTSSSVGLRAQRAMAQPQLGWQPNWINSTAWEFHPGVATIRHDLGWLPEGGAINRVKDGYGFEIGPKQRNASIPHLPGDRRPWCTFDRADSDFWAKRRSQTEINSWTVLAPGAKGEDYEPYLDHNNSLDSCREMELVVGIGKPQNIPKDTTGKSSRVFIEMVAPRGSISSNPAHAEIQTPKDECVGVPANTHCMGLDEALSDGSMLVLAENSSKSLPGSWHTFWNSGGDPEALYTADRCTTYGAIRGLYEGELGGRSGPLGSCFTWEYPAANNGTGQNFRNGRAYWHPAVATGQAKAVWGEIGRRFLELGAEGGHLKYPTSNELPCPNRGSCFFNRFETGNIYWSATTNAQAVWGAIFQEYGRQGYENGRFGLPTTSEFNVPGGKQVNFQGGWIRWDRATNRTFTS